MALHALIEQITFSSNDAPVSFTNSVKLMSYYMYELLWEYCMHVITPHLRLIAMIKKAPILKAMLHHRCCEATSEHWKPFGPCVVWILQMNI